MNTHLLLVCVCDKECCGDCCPCSVGYALGSEVTPLKTIHGSQVAFLTVAQPHAVQVLARAVSVPDVNVLVLKLLGVCGAVHEPQQFLRHPCAPTGSPTPLVRTRVVAAIFR